MFGDQSPAYQRADFRGIVSCDPEPFTGTPVSSLCCVPVKKKLIVAGSASSPKKALRSRNFDHVILDRSLVDKF